MLPGPILIVDDESNILEGLRLTMRGRFAVSTAQGPERALEMIRTRGPFAVVVSDLKMPGMNGVEFLARVRALSPFSVRIMLTGHGDLDAAVDAVNRGEVFRFLVKPCPVGTLDQALRDALAKHHQDVLGSRAVDALRAVASPPRGGGSGQPGTQPPENGALTPRELAIADGIRCGESSKEIARRMHLSVRTVEMYRDNIRKKLGLTRCKVNLRRYLSGDATRNDD